jgi:predicted AAA+ superfamily ATPase
MSLAETGVSNGQVSLTALLGLGDADASAEEPPPGAAPAGLDQMIEEVCRGGWPAGRCRTLRQSAQSVGDYANEVALADIRLPDGVRRDPVRASALLRALARNTGTAASVRTLARDSAASCAHLAETSAAAYLGALERLMVYEPLPAWSPILRSRARARVKPKHFFADPALSAALLDAGPDELRLDLKTFGFLFEGLAVRDLRAYGTACGADMFHFRDSNDLEVDIIASAGHQRWGAFEVKLGGASKAVDQGASTLLAFARNVDTQSVGHPRVLAVITAGGYSYRRPDGVTVIPLSMLGP